MSDLKPCPFCGSHEIMLFCDPDEGSDNSGPSRRVQCAGCNVEAPFYDTMAEAIAAWNCRALDLTSEGEAEECKTCVGTGTIETTSEGPPTFGFAPCPDCAPQPAQPEVVGKLPRFRIERPDEPHLIARHVLDDAGQWTRYEVAQAHIAALTAKVERWQQNNRDTFEAMCAMRNAINEQVPMPSLESDLLQGPENSVFCAAVAEAVVAKVEELTQERNKGRLSFTMQQADMRQFMDRADTADTAEARVAQFREALEFYADVSKYPAPLTGGMGALWEDCGQIARAALGGQSNEA